MVALPNCGIVREMRMTRIVGGFRARLLRAAAAVAFGTLALGGSPAKAAVVYNEGTSGDLSNSGLAPTPVTFALGENIVTGTTGRTEANAIDRDYWTFNIGPNQQLIAINVLQGTLPLGFSFIGIQSGSQVTVDPATVTAAGLLGWTHYQTSDVGTDILDDIGVAKNGSTGFTGPLGTGTYSVWLQEISPTPQGVNPRLPFSFAFVVASVPEPSTWAMMLLGFGGIGLALRRRRRAVHATANLSGPTTQYRS